MLAELINRLLIKVSNTTIKAITSHSYVIISKLSKGNIVGKCLVAHISNVNVDFAHYLNSIYDQIKHIPFIKYVPMCPE